MDAKYENKQRSDAQNASAKKKIEDLQGFVQRFGAHASKSSQAQSRLKQIEKLKDEVSSRGTKRSSLVRPFIRFEFEKPSGRDVLRMEGVFKKFKDETKAGKAEKIVYENAALNVNRGDRVAVIGPNGVGKSTLLKLMIGAYAGVDNETKPHVYMPDKGEIRWGHDASVGYFAQDHHEALSRAGAGTNAFQWLYAFDKLAPQEQVRGILGRLLFSGEAALKPVEALSGGECARLLLAKLLLLQHNVLILDEPTNHLDIESIEGLLDGIALFKGTVVFVSHDRHFVSKLATRVVELRAKPGDHGADIIDYGGTYDEFLGRAGTDYMRKA